MTLQSNTDHSGINSDRREKTPRETICIGHMPCGSVEENVLLSNSLQVPPVKTYLHFFLSLFHFIGGFDSQASAPLFQRSHNVVVIYFFILPFSWIVGSCVSPVCLCLRAIWAETENAWKPLCSEVGTKCWLQSPVRMAKLGNKRPLYESIHLTFVTFFREDFTRPVASILIWQTHTSLVSPWPLFKDSLTLFLRKHRKMCLMKPLISLQSCLPASQNPGSLFDLETNFCAKIN